MAIINLYISVLGYAGFATMKNGQDTIWQIRYLSHLVEKYIIKLPTLLTQLQNDGMIVKRKWAEKTRAMSTH